MNGFTFEDMTSPWDLAVARLKRGDMLSAQRFLTLMRSTEDISSEDAALELEQRGQSADFQTILHDIQQRDEQDRTRAVAPLCQAEDAVLLDTSELDLAQSLQSMLNIVKERIH